MKRFSDIITLGRFGWFMLDENFFENFLENSSEARGRTETVLST